MNARRTATTVTDPTPGVTTRLVHLNVDVKQATEGTATHVTVNTSSLKWAALQGPIDNTCTSFATSGRPF
jgi:hypothetical protein